MRPGRLTEELQSPAFHRLVDGLEQVIGPIPAQSGLPVCRIPVALPARAGASDACGLAFVAFDLAHPETASARVRRAGQGSRIAYLHV